MSRRPLRRCDGCDTLRPVGGLQRTQDGHLCGECRRVVPQGRWEVAPVVPVFRPAPGAMLLFESEAEMREALRGESGSGL